MRPARAVLVPPVLRALLPALGVAALAAGCALGGAGGGGGPVYEESMSPDWYATNAPLLIDYLDTLPDSAVGRPLDGILLSDGKRRLEGFTYLGRPKGLPEGVNVRLVDDGTRAIAYIWLDPDAAAFPLEPCPDGPQRGIRARRAGGGPYAWRALEPSHGLVYTICPPEAWLPADRPSARPPAATGD